MKLSSKILTRYYLFVTAGFALGIMTLPFGLWNWTPIWYIFLGPIVFAVCSFSCSARLSDYVQDHHPDLMKKYSIHYGARKGEVLNGFDVYLNRREFLGKEDGELTALLQLYLRSYALLLAAFFSLIVLAVLGTILR